MRTINLSLILATLALSMSRPLQAQQAGPPSANQPVGDVSHFENTASNSRGASRVDVKINQSSWRGGKFPNSDFIRSCASQGITITSGAAPFAFEIEYHEVPGKMFHSGYVEAQGTTIEYTLAGMNSGNGDVIVKLFSTVENYGQEEVLGGGASRKAFESVLHRSVRDQFVKSSVFRYTCTAMAAAVGSSSAYRRLLTWAVESNDGLQVIKTLAQQPKDPLEKAMLAIASKDFSDAATFPKNSAPYIQTFIATRVDDDLFSAIVPGVRSPTSEETFIAAIRALTALSPELAGTLLPSIVYKLDIYFDHGEKYGADLVIQQSMQSIGELGLVCTKGAKAIKLLSDRKDGVGELARELLSKRRCK